MHFNKTFYLMANLAALSNAVTIATRSPSIAGRSALQIDRYDAEYVEEMKRGLTHPPGYIFEYREFPVAGGNGTQLIPIIQGDPDVFLDNEAGVKARELAERQSGCFAFFGNPSNSCSITYCWVTTDRVTITAHLRIVGSNGASNPTSITTSFKNVLDVNLYRNNGYNGWFARNHACSNSDTIIYTLHRISGPPDHDLYTAGSSLTASAKVDHVRCNTCDFSGLTCDDSLKDNLLAFTNGRGTGITCRYNMP